MSRLRTRAVLVLSCAVLASALEQPSDALHCRGSLLRRVSLLRLRGGRVEACLFDFDGTLVQSEDVHRRSFGTVLGVELSEDYWNSHCVGRSPRMIMEHTLPAHRLQQAHRPAAQR